MDASGLEVTCSGRNILRQTDRAVARINSWAGISIAQVNAGADIHMTQVDAATAVTQRALQGAAFITSIECALAEATPAAMTRLKLIGDSGVMALQQITLDTAAKLRRI